MEKNFETFVEELILKIKTDDEFFEEFVNFLRRFGKREIILRIVKKTLLDSCEKIKFSE